MRKMSVVIRKKKMSLDFDEKKTPYSQTKNVKVCKQYIVRLKLCAEPSPLSCRRTGWRKQKQTFRNCAADTPCSRVSACTRSFTTEQAPPQGELKRLRPSVTIQTTAIVVKQTRFGKKNPTPRGSRPLLASPSSD